MPNYNNSFISDYEQQSIADNLSKMQGIANSSSTQDAIRQVANVDDSFISKDDLKTINKNINEIGVKDRELKSPINTIEKPDDYDEIDRDYNELMQANKTENELAGTYKDNNLNFQNYKDYLEVRDELNEEETRVLDLMFRGIEPKTALDYNIIIENPKLFGVNTKAQIDKLKKFSKDLNDFELLKGLINANDKKTILLQSGYDITGDMDKKTMTEEAMKVALTRFLVQNPSEAFKSYKERGYDDVYNNVEGIYANIFGAKGNLEEYYAELQNNISPEYHNGDFTLNMTATFNNSINSFDNNAKLYDAIYSDDEEQIQKLIKNTNLRSKLGLEHKGSGLLYDFTQIGIDSSMLMAQAGFNKDNIKYALGSGTAYAGYTFLAQNTTLFSAPTEVVTVPTAFVIGAIKGNTVAMGVNLFKQYTAQSYSELRNNGISHELSKKIAPVVGSLSVMAENISHSNTFGMGSITGVLSKKFAETYGKKILTAQTKKEVEQLFHKFIKRELVEYGKKNIIKEGLKEASEEVLQYSFGVGGQAFADLVEDRQYTEEDVSENYKNILTGLLDSAYYGFGASIFMGGGHFMFDNIAEKVETKALAKNSIAFISKTYDDINRKKERLNELKKQRSAEFTTSKKEEKKTELNKEQKKTIKDFIKNIEEENDAKVGYVNKKSKEEFGDNASVDITKDEEYLDTDIRFDESNITLNLEEKLRLIDEVNAETIIRSGLKKVDEMNEKELKQELNIDDNNEITKSELIKRVKTNRENGIFPKKYRDSAIEVKKERIDLASSIDTETSIETVRDLARSIKEKKEKGIKLSKKEEIVEKAINDSGLDINDKSIGDLSVDILEGEQEDILKIGLSKLPDSAIDNLVGSRYAGENRVKKIQRLVNRAMQNTGSDDVLNNVILHIQANNPKTQIIKTNKRETLGSLIESGMLTYDEAINMVIESGKVDLDIVKELTKGVVTEEDEDIKDDIKRSERVLNMLKGFEINALNKDNIMYLFATADGSTVLEEMAEIAHKRMLMIDKTWDNHIKNERKRWEAFTLGEYRRAKGDKKLALKQSLERNNTQSNVEWLSDRAVEWSATDNTLYARIGQSLKTFLKALGALKDYLIGRGLYLRKFSEKGMSNKMKDFLNTYTDEVEFDKMLSKYNLETLPLADLNTAKLKSKLSAQLGNVSFIKFEDFKKNFMESSENEKTIKELPQSDLDVIIQSKYDKYLNNLSKTISNTFNDIKDLKDKIKLLNEDEVKDLIDDLSTNDAEKYNYVKNAVDEFDKLQKMQNSIPVISKSLMSKLKNQLNEFDKIIKSKEEEVLKLVNFDELTDEQIDRISKLSNDILSYTNIEDTIRELKQEVNSEKNNIDAMTHNYKSIDLFKQDLKDISEALSKEDTEISDDEINVLDKKLKRVINAVNGVIKEKNRNLNDKAMNLRNILNDIDSAYDIKNIIEVNDEQIKKDKNIGNDTTSLEEEQKNLKAQYKNYLTKLKVETLSEAHQKVAQLEEEIKTLKFDYDSLVVSNNNIVQDYAIALNKAEKGIRSYDRHTKNLQQQIKSLESQVDELSKNTASAKELKDAKDLITYYENTVAEFEEDEAQYRKKAQYRMERISKLLSKMKKRKSELSDVREEKRRLKEELKRVKSSRKSLKDKFNKKIDKIRKDLQEKNKNLRIELSNKRKEIRRYTRMLETSNAKKEAYYKSLLEERSLRKKFENISNNLSELKDKFDETMQYLREVTKDQEFSASTTNYIMRRIDFIQKAKRLKHTVGENGETAVTYGKQREIAINEIVSRIKSEIAKKEKQAKIDKIMSLLKSHSSKQVGALKQKKGTLTPELTDIIDYAYKVSKFNGKQYEEEVSKLKDKTFTNSTVRKIDILNRFSSPNGIKGLDIKQLTTTLVDLENEIKKAKDEYKMKIGVKARVKRKMQKQFLDSILADIDNIDTPSNKIAMAMLTNSFSLRSATLSTLAETFDAGSQELYQGKIFKFVNSKLIRMTNDFIRGMNDCNEFLVNTIDETIGRDKEIIDNAREKVNTGIIITETIKDDNGEEVEVEKELVASPFTAVTFINWWKNDGSKKKLEKQGFTEDTIRELKTFLGNQKTKKKDGFLKLADKLLDYYQKDYYEINDVHVKLNNANLTFVDNYSPTRAIHKNYEEFEMSMSKFENKVDGLIAGALIDRSDKSSLDIDNCDCIDIFSQHTIAIENWKSKALGVKAIKDYLLNPYVSEKLKNKYGGASVAQFNKLLDKFVMEGAKNSMRLGLVDKMLSNFVKAKMLGNIGALTKQIGSDIMYTVDMPINEFIKRNTVYLSNPRSSFYRYIDMLKRSTILRDRYKSGSINEAIKNIENAYENKGIKSKNIIEKSIEIGMLPTKIGDFLGIMTGGLAYYDYKFENYLKDGLDEVEAKRLAMNDFEIMTSMTQQSGLSAFMSEIQQSGNSLTKMFTVFLNTAFSYFRITTNASANLLRGKGSKKNNLKALIITQIIAPAIFAGIGYANKWAGDAIARMLGYDVDDDDEYDITTEEGRTHFMNTLLVSPSSTVPIPLAGDLLQVMFYSAIEGKIPVYIGQEKIVGESALNTKRLMSDLKKEEYDEVMFDILRLSEPFTGLPATRAIKMYKNLYK